MSNLKITAGKYRGRNIQAPDTGATHPMGARERLALFNSLVSLGVDFATGVGCSTEMDLSAQTDGLEVLDLYAGSGALGIEALSRGAKKAVFVDNNRGAVNVIRANLQSLGLEAQAEAIFGKAASVSGRKFSLILADPPYDHYPDDLAFIADLLTPDGVLVLSHPTSVNPESVLTGQNRSATSDQAKVLKLVSAKSYAGANISIFAR